MNAIPVNNNNTHPDTSIYSRSVMVVQTLPMGLITVVPWFHEAITYVGIVLKVMDVMR